MQWKRYRVLFAAHSAQVGGAELCLDTTLRFLDHEQFEPIVLFPHEGPMAESARQLGCEVLIRPCCHWLYFSRNLWYWKNLAGRLAPNILRLARLVRRRGIDLVYTNTSAIFETAFAARLARVPHVWHVHEVLKAGNRMDQLLPLSTMKRLIYRLSDRVIFESHSARTVFEDAVPGDRSVVIYNSARFADSHCTRRDVDRARFGLASEECVIGFVGQFIDRKNPLLLVRAMARLSHIPQLVCLLAGDGPLLAQVQSEIARLGLQSRCRIVGFQDDIRSLMNAIDVLVLPSRQESFGLVLVEAGAYGRPAIACASEGPSEIIIDGESGFLIPQDDERELAQKLELVFRPEYDREAMGRAAARRVDDLFHPVKNTRRLEDTFRRVLQPLPTPCRASS